MIEIADAINSFASQLTHAQAPVPQSNEPVFILTASQLQELICQAIQKATEPLLDRISRLETLEEVYHGPAPQPEEIPLLRDCLTRKREVLNDLPSRVWSIEEDLSKMEETRTSTPQHPSKKTTDHIDDLHRLMVEDRTQQVSIAKAARLLGICKERMRQLKPLIMSDGRFELGWSQVKGKKAVIIRIRQFLK